MGFRVEVDLGLKEEAGVLENAMALGDGDTGDDGQENSEWHQGQAGREHQVQKSKCDPYGNQSFSCNQNAKNYACHCNHDSDHCIEQPISHRHRVEYGWRGDKQNPGGNRVNLFAKSNQDFQHRIGWQLNDGIIRSRRSVRIELIESHVSIPRDHSRPKSTA